MHGTVGWHDHIGSGQQVGEYVWLADLFKDLVVMLDLIHVLELQFCLALPFLCLPVGLILFLLCNLSLFPGSLLRLSLHIHHYLTVHDLTLAFHLFGGRKGIVGQALSITGKLFFEIKVKFGERGIGSASSFHEDLLCGLKCIFGTGLWMQSQQMVGVLLERDYLMDCIAKYLRESSCANYSLIFSIFFVTISYSNFLLSQYCETSQLS